MPKEFLLNVSDGMKLQAYIWEPEAKETVNALVVFIHGIGEYAGRFDDFARYFSSQGIAVYSMDLRGHGQSPGKRGHTAPRTLIHGDMDELCKKALVDYPGKPLFIYGHSMGGNIVLSHRISGNIRPRAYIVTSPWIILYKKVSEIQVFVLRLLSKISPEACISSAINPSDLTSDETQIIPHDPMAHDRISIRTAIDSYEYGKAAIHTAHEDHGELLLLHGASDHICSVEGSRQFMSHAHLLCVYKEWEECRHELHHERRREEVREFIKDWIFEKLNGHT